MNHRFAARRVGPWTLAFLLALAPGSRAAEDYRDFHTLAESYRARGNLERAERARAAKILRLHGHALERLGKPELARDSLRRAVRIEASLDEALGDTLFRGLEIEVPVLPAAQRGPLFMHHIRQDGASGFHGGH